MAGRDDTRAQACAREAANTAVDAIDAKLGGPHRLRSGLVAEIRQADDATEARAGALLAECRAGVPAQNRQRGVADLSCQRLQTLEDALRYRRARLAEPCAECSATDGGLCADHDRDTGLIGEYEATARALLAGTDGVRAARDTAAARAVLAASRRSRSWSRTSGWRRTRSTARSS